MQAVRGAHTIRSVWQASRLAERTKRQLLERFVLGVPVYRQRFRTPASAKAAERFYRLARACCAYSEHLREPFEGVVECDGTTFGGRRKVTVQTRPLLPQTPV